MEPVIEDIIRDYFKKSEGVAPESFIQDVIENIKIYGIDKSRKTLKIGDVVEGAFGKTSDTIVKIIGWYQGSYRRYTFVCLNKTDDLFLVTKG